MKKSKVLIFAFLFVIIGLLFSGFKVSADVQTSNQITIQGAQVRTAGSAGIRFVGYVDTNLVTDEISAYGMAIAFGDANVADIVIGATVNDKSVLSAQVSTITDENYYYINLVNIPNTMYGQKVTARAYYVSNGKTIYSDVSTTRSLGQVTLAVKASGSSTDLIESIYSDLSTNYKNVYTDELGNVFVTSSVYETNPKKLEKEFVADWNNKFGTTMESFDYTTWQTSAKNGTTPLTANSGADCSGTNAYAFFNTDETMSAKWQWLLNFLVANRNGTVHPLRQINAILGNGTASDSYGSGMNQFVHLARSLQNFFNADGTDVLGSNIDVVIKDLSKYINIAQYNNVILANPADLVYVGKEIDLPEIPVSEGYTFEGYTVSGNKCSDSYTVTAEDAAIMQVTTANEYSIIFMNGESVITSLELTYTVENKVTLPTYELDGYDFLGWYDNSDCTGTPVTNFTTGNTGDKVYYAKLQETGYSKVNVNYDLNGGYFLYDSVESAIEDFLKDYNTARSKSYTASAFSTIGSMTEVSDASLLLYNATYKAKWEWLVNYIATVASNANKAAFVNFYNYNSQAELNSANGNYIYMISYELRGWVGQIQYTKNASYKTADYSSDAIQASALLAAKGETSYVYKNPCDLLTPKKENFTFVGWESSIDGSVVTEFPGYSTNPGNITYTAKWEGVSSITLNGVSYNTLSAALNAATAGDVIYLPAGTNNESVTITKSVTIKGNNAGVNPNTSTRNAETVLTGVITIGASTGLTIDGVAFTGTGQINSVTTAAIKNLTIKNVYAYNISSDSTWTDSARNYDQTYVINLIAGTYQNITNVSIIDNKFEVKEGCIKFGRIYNATIEGNSFLNFEVEAIRFEGGYNGGSIAIENNKFENSTLKAYAGVYFNSYGGSSTTEPLTVNINNNTFKNIGSGSGTYITAIGCKAYQEMGANWYVNDNTFEKCTNYMMMRNNATAANHSSYPWTFEADNNTFIGVPSGVYYKSKITSSDTSTTNPAVAVFTNTKFKDASGNTITPDLSKLLDVASISIEGEGEIIGEFETVSYVVKGQNIQLLTTYIDSSISQLTWKSENSEIATVTSSGTVTGVSEGVATIVVYDSSNTVISFTFYVTVFEEDPTGILQLLVDSNNANVFTKDNLIIGIAGQSPTPYYADIVGGVSKLLFEDYVVHKDYYLNNPSNTSTLNGTGKGGVDFITVHYAADMPYSANYSLKGGSNLASANKSYNTNGTGASWHYSVGNDGVWYCQNTAYGAWHAGSKKDMTWTKTNVLYQAGDPEFAKVTLGNDGYFYINGRKTNVANTTGGSKLNGYGLACEVRDGYYYLGGAYYNSSYGYISSTGGNNNSIGMETSVREGSDLWLTWQYTAQLCAQLLIEFELPLTRLVGHHFFSGKWCPQPMVENDLEIWWEFVELVRQEKTLFEKYNGAKLLFSSSSGYLDDNGRIVSQPIYSQCVTYTVEYTFNGETKSVTLSSIVPGTIK